MIKLLRNARLIGKNALMDIMIEGDKIKSVNLAKPSGEKETNIVEDLNGRIVLPGFVDIHTHLDKAYTFPTLKNRTGTLLEAVDRFCAYQSSVSVNMLEESMTYSIHQAIKRGTTAIRTHLDAASSEYVRRVVIAFNHVKEKFSDCIDLEAVMMCPLQMTKEAEKDIKWALRNGINIVGGAHQLADRPEHNLDTIFDIAVSMNADIDIHVDESDDPNVSSLPQICKMTEDANYQGRVTAGHCTSLAAMEEKQAHEILLNIKEAGINIVTLPGTNMYLLGRQDIGLIRRGLTRVKDMLSLNIPLAVASDNVQDPFHPYGNGDLLQMALLASYGAHLSTQEEMQKVLEMITTVPAMFMGEYHGIEPGRHADFVVLGSYEPELILSEQTHQRETWKNGVCISKTRVEHELLFEK